MKATPAGTTGPTGNGAAPTSADKRVSDPPQRPSRSVTWLLVLLTLIIAAGPMLIDLGGPEVAGRAGADASFWQRVLDRSGEARALVTTVHSVRRHEAGNGAGQGRMRHLLPYYNGKSSLERAPGTYWMYRLVMAKMSVPLDDVDQLVAVARRVSVGMALLTVAAVFWCGFSVGGQRAGGVAALVLASNPIFIFHARQATPAICHMGWATLSIAAALWAIRPLKPSPSPERQLTGWVICGLALGAATLTGGSVVAITVAVPILLLLLLCENRVGHFMGLLAALFMGLLAVLPWVLYAHEQKPDIWQEWVANLWSAGAVPLTSPWLEAGWRALLLAVAVLPWTIWYIAGAAQPFSTSSRGQRIRLLLGGLWFLAVALALLAMPEGNQVGYVLPALAPGAVLLGQLFNYYAERASTGRHIRTWSWFRWPHLLLLAAASVVAPIALFTETWLTQADDWQRWPADLPGWVLPTVVAAGLLVLVLIGARWAWKHYPAKAMVGAAIWAIVLMAVAALPLTHLTSAGSDVRATAELIGAETGRTPTYYWYALGEPDPAILFYAQRTLPSVDPAEVSQAIKLNQAFYLIGPAQMPVFADRLTEVDTPLLIDADTRLWHFAPSDE